MTPDDALEALAADAVQLATALGFPLPSATARRLVRFPPDLPGIVQGTQPVVAFGNPMLADVATIGINPSVAEFLDSQRRPLVGDRARLMLLPDEPDFSWHRSALAAYGACLAYFSRNPYRRWFDVLQRTALDPLGRSYDDSSACHLDLVQWATDPVWGQLADPAVRSEYLAADAQFLADQLDDHQFKVLLLNGRQVVDQARALGLVNIDEVGEVSIGHQGRHATLYKGRCGDTVVLGWSLNLQHSAVTSNNRAEVTAWLATEAATLGLNPRPISSVEHPYCVASVNDRGVALGWPGGARELFDEDFPRTTSGFDIDATRRSLATGVRPWTAIQWLELLAADRPTSELATFATLDEAHREARRRLRLRPAEVESLARGEAKPMADAVSRPQDAATSPDPAPDDTPAWETTESRWEGWLQFCDSHPTEAEMLALGRPMSAANLLTLRSLQQPWTSGSAPHRYLPWTPEDPECWACQGAQAASVHSAWTPGRDEAQPRILDLDDLVDFALDAAGVDQPDSVWGRWQRARYQATRRALSFDVELLAEVPGAALMDEADERPPGNLVDLFAYICAAYRHASAVEIGRGVMETPRAWAPVLEGYDVVLDARSTAMRTLRHMARKIVTTIDPDVADRRATTDVLWQQGIPLAEPVDDPDLL